MSDVIAFSFENNKVRTLGTPETPLFIAADVCAALKHSNPRQALRDNVDPEDQIWLRMIGAFLLPFFGEWGILRFGAQNTIRSGLRPVSQADFFVSVPVADSSGYGRA